jgi:hypothetical protein
LCQKSLLIFGIVPVFQRNWAETGFDPTAWQGVSSFNNAQIVKSSALLPKADIRRSLRHVRFVPIAAIIAFATDLCHGAFVPFERDLTNVRAQSMQRCATGLIVRFFSVTMPTGPGRIATLIGTGFNPNLLPLSCTVEAGATVRKRPVRTIA